MNARGIKGLMGGVLVLAPLLCATALSASQAPAPAPEEQLDEILVEGEKPVRDADKITEWLTRLVGQFVVEGSVDLHGKGAAEPLDVQGRSTCVGFFPTKSVQCELRLRWPEVKGPQGEALPGGVSHLDPAIMLFGYEPRRIGIRHMLVGDDGIAEDALGYLISGNTVVSRNKCVNVPGQCERVVRIRADPDLKVVEMRIDWEVDGLKAVSYRFEMHRTQVPK